MKVFLDGSIFGQQKVGCISRVGFELAKELGKKKDVEQIFYHGLHIDSHPFKREWFKKYYCFKRPSFSKGRVFNLLGNFFVNYFYNINADENVIYQSLYYRIPKKPKGPIVVICYDMIHELFSGDVKSIAFKKRAFDKADLIVAMSESTKRDLCKLYPIDPKKVIIAYPGVGEVFFKDYALVRKSEKRPYMLYVGSRGYRYKNFNIVLDAFLDKKYFLNFDLVLVGGEKELTLEQKEKIKQVDGQGSWILQEFCDDKILADLYANAAMLIYPSLYEGFGIPPIEAMACGCPVVASNTPAVAEAVGDAGLLFDPKNSDDLAQKIEKIIHDKILVADLIKKGKIRAKQFTWENMTDTIYWGYQMLL